ncbi:glycosyltransferase family 4 protein [Fervidobacterium sp.]
MKVLHAPIEIAGQLWEYTDALSKIGVEAHLLTYGKHPFGYKTDYCVELSNISDIYDLIGLQLKTFTEVSGIFDIFHFHFGESLIHQNLDLPALKRMGKKVVMNFWGSDVRLRNIAKSKNPYYTDEIHLGDDSAKIEKMKIIAKYVDVVIVPDFELYEYIVPFFKNIAFVRQAVDTELLKPFYPEPNNKIPLIVHAPSRTNVKGTGLIENCLSSLSSKYPFEYQRLNGVSHEKVIEILSKADIVIDQLLLGSHGILSLEAMALGKPVICYIRDDLRKRYPNELPIINANPLNLEKALEKLIKSAQLRHEIGKNSRRYVELYHDKKKIATELMNLYNSL